jgi:hypothetical protein
MRKLFALSALALALAMSIPAYAQTSPHKSGIKTRLDHLSGTPYVLVVSYLPEEITSITCEKWVMLGVNSWKGQNNFTIPTGPAVAIINTNGFDGYCKDAGSIVAHTDDGDYVGSLDRGDGNWTDSTKLTFNTTAQ